MQVQIAPAVLQPKVEVLVMTLMADIAELNSERRFIYTCKVTSIKSTTQYCRANTSGHPVLGKLARDLSFKLTLPPSEDRRHVLVGSLCQYPLRRACKRLYVCAVLQRGQEEICARQRQMKWTCPSRSKTPRSTQHGPEALAQVLLYQAS